MLSSRSISSVLIVVLLSLLVSSVHGRSIPDSLRLLNLSNDVQVSSTYAKDISTASSNSSPSFTSPMTSLTSSDSPLSSSSSTGSVLSSTVHILSSSPHLLSSSHNWASSSTGVPATHSQTPQSMIICGIIAAIVVPISLLFCILYRYCVPFRNTMKSLNGQQGKDFEHDDIMLTHEETSDAEYWPQQ